MNGYVVTMPQLGELVSQGTIMKWLVKIGEYVAELDALVEISTDKVETEVPAPIGGILLEILAHEDDTVPVGAPIAVIEPATLDQVHLRRG